MAVSEPKPSTKAFTFIELLVVALIVVVWYTGVKIAEFVPAPIVEIMLSAGFFVILFMVLRRVLFEYTKEGHPLFYYRRQIWILFLAHIAFIYLFRFAFNIEIFTAYFSSLLLLVVIPIVGICLYIPIKERRGERTGMDAGRIRQIALECEIALDFVKRFPKCRIYIYDHAAKNQYGKCLFLHRHKRPENETIFEDVILEVLVDMRSKQPALSERPYTRYIFQAEDFGSTVLELPCSDIPDLDRPLDESILNRFNGVLGEFPSLDSAPLPIASRQTAYEIIE